MFKQMGCQIPSVCTECNILMLFLLSSPLLLSKLLSTHTKIKMNYSADKNNPKKLQFYTFLYSAAFRISVLNQIQSIIFFSVGEKLWFIQIFQTKEN